MTFETLGLAPALLRALAEEGYTEPTPIQTTAIPVALEGRDLLAGAQTGTGKTAAFALPLLDRLYISARKPTQPKTPRALVLTPTRELAAQVHDSIRALRPPSRRALDDGIRRRRHAAAGRCAAPRRRYPRRDARPPARPHRTAQRQSLRHRSARARRSRSHARHGLPAGDPAHPRRAAEEARHLALLGDVRAGDQDARRAVHAGSGRDPGRQAATASRRR